MAAAKHDRAVVDTDKAPPMKQPRKTDAGTVRQPLGRLAGANTTAGTPAPVVCMPPSPLAVEGMTCGITGIRNSRKL
jgi:hypothetical protein